jgi:ATP-dependent protease ClpP protease subunit
MEANAMSEGYTEPEELEQERQQVIDFGTAVTTTGFGTIYTLTIIGQIEGHQTVGSNVKTTKYEHVLPLLASVEESEDIDGLLLLINTVGGDIEAGLAIAELIVGMNKPTVSLVLGGGHSIGVPLAVAAKQSLIAPSAGMTIHPVRMTGMVVGVPQTFRYFSRIQERIVDFVTAHSNISREDFLQYMMATDEMATDVGTVIYGREAVDCGLIDRLGSLGDALDCLHQMIAERGGRKMDSSEKR